MLEVDTPTSPVLRAGYRRLVQQGGAGPGRRALGPRRPTAYLPASVAYLPPTPVLRQMLLGAGFSAVGIRPLAGGLSQLVVATRARTAALGRDRHDRRLHARTVPLEYGPDALQFDGSPTVLFDRPGLTLVGWGTAAARRGRPRPTRRCAAIPCDDRSAARRRAWSHSGHCRSRGHVGGLLVIPRFTMGIVERRRRGDPPLGHRGRAGGRAAARHRRALRRGHLAVRHRARRESARPTCSVSAVATPLDRRPRRQVARAGRHHAGARSARLRKVVLSRPVTVELDGPLPLSPVLRRLRAAEPTCTVFAMPGPDGTFFGASPELLVARHGRTSPVTRWPAPSPAGTPPAPTPTPRADSPARTRTRPSTATSSTTSPRRCAPFCDDLTVPDDALAGHLPLRGPPRHPHRGPAREPAPAILELLDRLHPTPAVGGTPGPTPRAPWPRRAGARGYWAGPVGWADARGDGEWMIGIRSARLHPDGAHRHAARRLGHRWRTPTPTPRRTRPTSSWPPSSTR